MKIIATPHGNPSRVIGSNQRNRAGTPQLMGPVPQGCHVRHQCSTTITAIIPRFGAGHTLPVLFPAKGDSAPGYVESAPLVLANLNCVILDYLARQKVHGNHLAWYLLEQLPVVPPAAYVRMFGTKSAADMVREIVLELTYTAHDLAPFARDMGYVDANGDALPPSSGTRSAG